MGQHVGQEDKQPADSDGEVAQPGDGTIQGRRDPAAPAVGQHVGQEDELIGDLGFFIQATKSLEEISESVCRMSDAQKYHLLRNHDRPSKHFIFFNSIQFSQFIGGCNRAFKYEWLEEHGWWLVYSRKLDGAFRVCCALFLNAKERKQLSSMVNAPFTKWYKKTKAIGNDSSKSYHLAALERAKLFLQSIENPKTQISVRMDSAKTSPGKQDQESPLLLRISSSESPASEIAS